MQLISIEKGLEDLKAGKFLIVVDDEDRENEGDLVMPAQHVTPDAVNFMVTHARGQLCMPMLPERLAELDIPMLPSRHSDSAMPTAPAGTSVLGVANRGHAIRESMPPRYGNPGAKPSMKTR